MFRQKMDTVTTLSAPSKRLKSYELMTTGGFIAQENVNRSETGFANAKDAEAKLSQSQPCTELLTAMRDQQLKLPRAVTGAYLGKPGAGITVSLLDEPVVAGYLRVPRGGETGESTVSWFLEGTKRGVLQNSDRIGYQTS